MKSDKTVSDVLFKCKMRSVVACVILITTCDVFADQLHSIDFNRLQVVTALNPHANKYNQESSNHYRRSISDYNRKTNDYDDHSGGFHSHAPPPEVRGRSFGVLPPPSKQEAGRRLYQPKEDPKSFYQSQPYLRQVAEKNGVVNEVGGVYPGFVSEPGITKHGVGHDADLTDTARILDKQSGVRSPNKSDRYQELNSVTDYDDDICIKCPAERTVVAKPGVHAVLLQVPLLRTCSGRKPPTEVHFMRMYGPTFGSLVSEGSHMVVGKVVYQGQELQYCRFHVHVVTQTCAVPRHLVSHCAQANCTFTCASAALQPVGTRSLRCGADLRWSGRLPRCRVRTWCQPPALPGNGRLSCQSAPAGRGGLAEGSRCRARCAPGYRAVARAAVCRRGSWTNALSCLPTHRPSNETV